MLDNARYVKCEAEWSAGIEQYLRPDAPLSSDPTRGEQPMRRADEQPMSHARKFCAITEGS
jgi:hypothetical protein